VNEETIPMRISRAKIQKIEPSDIKLVPEDAEQSLAGRRQELAALIQAALKVGADLSAREAGRRAFSEFMKLVPGTQAANSVAVAASGQVMFTGPKRKRIRAMV
jgi:hypothetical protein